MKKLSYFLSLVFIVSLFLTQNVQAQEKKRWSPQAKGTVIGTGAGAAAGAIINKRNRVAGGVVGGVVGGATGYAIGKRKDNKNKEAARVAAANQAAAERAAAERTAANRAEENRVATTNKTAPAKTVANNKPATVAYNSFSNSQPNGLINNSLPKLANAAYLPNPSYGDRSKPYSEFEYRRKSW